MPALERRRPAMKRVFLLAPVFLLILACSGMPPAERAGAGPEARRQLQELMERWLAALQHRDLDLMIQAYWPEAERVVLQPGREEQHFRGLDAIREAQMHIFDREPQLRQLRYGEPHREIGPSRALYVYQVEGPGIRYRERFELERRGDRWGIILQVLEVGGLEPERPGMGPGETRVASDFQAWADANSDGRLDPPERQRLVEAVHRLVAEPHPVESPPDEKFDLDRNGQIDPSEVFLARNVLFREQFRLLYRYPGAPAPEFDENRDGSINLAEVDWIPSFLFSPELRQPREARDPIGRRLDLDGNGRVESREVEEYTGRLLLVGSLLPLPAVPEPREPDKPGVFAYLDLDQNGSLEPVEVQDLVHLVRATLGEMEHAADNPLGRYFDTNRDGRLDARETVRARQRFMQALVRPGTEVELERAKRLIDRNQDGKVDDEEMAMAAEQLFQMQELPEPRQATSALDRQLDQNKDGRVDQEELQRGRDLLIRAAALAWLGTPEDGEEPWRVATVLDELADLDGDGLVGPEENRTAMRSLQEPHRVGNPFDERIDFNGNGEVEPLELVRARRAGAVSREAQVARDLPVATAIDGYLDLDGNGKVEREEIARVVRLFRSGQMGETLPGRWQELLDLDRNGLVSRDELLAGAEMYLRPHPVNANFKLDRQLDANSDGFVAPEEIGITAGYSPGAELPGFDQRIEQLGWEEEMATAPAREAGPEAEAREQPRVAAESTKGQARFESEYYKKLGTIQDRKLAVVGISSGTKNVDAETAGGVKVFIENAFVNVGKVRVVDRQNIDKIVKEYEFQQSDLTDEATAVKIGKLSGADIIVIGSISYVGSKYYLNIKLIAVETGEIIGSSIDDAQEADDFYEMCNEAVYKLF
jgi:Ca2+-binding EF-hand superfamily protein